MLASALTSALLLLASAVNAQETPSVVTSIAISPSPTTEELFTVETSAPGSGLPTSSDGLMSIPPGETPEPTSVVSIITDTILPSVSGVVSIPGGETPISTVSLNSSATLSSSLSPSSTGSAPPQQSTNVASPAMGGDGTPFMVAVVGVAIALL
ncbi:hypothetical protein N0V83_005572 [Neocucurbitaria cava]|uniref:Uncharacterized protein n=1 Tax=Neocucurbitaria cava TaxID=798079 RepID=A0A9W8Y718_9PLEO|nr:hypothetical protein N0V83_005572 [Neocucurbitaria cava]